MTEALRKLNIVQSELNAPKGQFNKFGNYKYRSCEDILSGLKPLLAEHGAVVVISDDLEAIGDRYYIKATATFYCCESGEEISNTAYAREELSKKGMDSSQITGSTSSYARKYALNGLLAIDDTRDADTQDNTNHETTQEPEKEWLNDISGLVLKAEENGWTAEQAVMEARLYYKVSRKTADEIKGAING